MAALGVSLLSSRSSICAGQYSLSTRAATHAAASRGSLVCMAVKPTRAGDFRSLSNEDIEAKVYELKKELFFLRVKKAKREEFKPSEFSRVKLTVAQLLTVKREREVEQGISKRESRNIQRRKMVEAGLGKFR